MIDYIDQIRLLAKKDPIRFLLLFSFILSIFIFTYVLAEFFKEHAEVNLETIRSCELISASMNEHVCSAYDCQVTKNAFNFMTPIHVKSLYYPSETIITPVYSREESDRQVILKSAENNCIAGKTTCYNPSWKVSMVQLPNEANLYSGVVTLNEGLAQQVLNSMQPYTKYYCFLNDFNDLTIVPPSVTYIPKKIFMVLMINVGIIVMSFTSLKLLGLYRRLKHKKDDDEESKPINASE